ncbi:MmgE/PrpD family protein [Micromonospora carbonacea]|uniref:2-methylcitrate dehydratase PrpD n=1 Tax=Micromonospora carbonacea TaxID=47853 RepID=A0A1C4V9C1_9ACTN|nr:MmgE/PrpD family protein [Micromonospora carbonacea]SCE80355.1 2-methylcitrate dehydratase PrpD [Micromonospora carbonacea]
MADRTLSQQLADFVMTTKGDGLPDAVSVSVRDRILDILGLCIASRRLDTSRAVLAYAREQGGAAQAHAIGEPAKLPAASAALVNGVLAHSLDYDDTHLPSVLHPSASVIPAALAAAEYADADGEALLRAIAVGLEVTVRLGMAGYDRATNNSTFFEHGQHATSICGAIGGATAAAVLLDLDETKIVDAIGVAASMASGVIEANRTGGTVKRLHCGWAAHAAVSAAQLVRHGFTGPPTVLEGRFGFFQAFLRGEFDASAIIDGLGENWTVPDIFFKPYPANHFTHTIVDAGHELREQGVDPDRIVALTIGVPAPVVRTVGEPIERKIRPTTTYEAQFSGPYAAVIGLLGGSGLGAALPDYAPALLGDPRRLRLMSRAEVVADDECTAIFPNQFPAVVRAHTDDGREWTARVMVNRGGPQRPLSADELRVKFRDNVAGQLDTTTCDMVEQAVAGIGRGTQPGELLSLTHTTPRQ